VKYDEIHMAPGPLVGEWWCHDQKKKQKTDQMVETVFTGDRWYCRRGDSRVRRYGTDYRK
jgi:hypothetical protein